MGPSDRPTNDISIEFELKWKFAMLLLITCSVDRNRIFYTSRQLHCRDVCKIQLWSVDHILYQSTPNFDRISNSIEIPLVGRAPCYNDLGAVSIRKTVLPGMAIRMLKIRRPKGPLIFNMEITIRR